MPTYEYQCDACDHRFELYQPITSNAIRKCPKCGRLKVRRLISGGGAIIFKGSGFYATDYRSESYRQAAKKDSAPTPTPAAATGAAGAASETAGSSSSGSADSSSAASKPAEKAKPSAETKKGGRSSASTKAAQ